MELSDLNERQLDSFIDNYRTQGKVTGGKFSLSELQLERQRRIKSPFPPADVAKTIVTLAKKSADGLVTYKEIWQVYRPDAVWVGNAPRSEMAKALGSVIAYCIDNSLPILTTLVVRGDSRSHSDEAKINIWNEAQSLGVDVGLDPAAFVQQQQIAALKLAEEWPE